MGEHTVERPHDLQSSAIPISGFYLPQIRELLQIENGMGHILPDFTALEYLLRSRLVKTRQFFGKACKSGTLAVIGQPSKRRAKHGIQTRLHGGSLSFDQVVRPEASLVENEGIIQQRQGLCRHVRGIAIAARNGGIGKIEGVKKTRTFVPRHLDIDAAAAIAVQWPLMQLAIVLGLFPVRLNAWTVQRAVQASGSCQNGIANRFTFKPPDRVVRQEPVLRIARDGFRQKPGSIAERSAT